VVGLQATDLLIAVHLAFGPIEKEAEVALIPEERPVRTSLISFFDSGFKRIGAPIFHCRFCGLDSRDLFTFLGVHSPWFCGTDVHPRMGAGLLEAATVLP
jgi:hypothetical protein